MKETQYVAQQASKQGAQTPELDWVDLSRHAEKLPPAQLSPSNKAGKRHTTIWQCTVKRA